MQKSTAIFITRGGDHARSRRRTLHDTAQLLNDSALHFAQGRLLLCRALPGLDPADAHAVRKIADAIHAVIVLLSKGRTA